MSDYILEMNHITKEFSGVKALDDVNIKVKRGEIHALCGENGAGKSTLMNVLSGVYPFGSYSGDIVYNGNVCQFHSIKQSEAKGIVIIHQELALSPYMSVAENVFLGNEQKAAKGIIDWTLTHKKAQEMLEKVGLGGENLNAPISSLGVGKQQLIEIAKAMAKKVELLILDEPTAALNDEESRRLLDIMLDLKSHGITSIIISHKLNEISYVADSITVIRDGKTIETLEKGRDEFTEDRIIKGMVGRELTNRYPERHCEIGDTIFEIKDWNVYHSDDAQRQVIKDVSLHVRKGEVVGLAGLMGAGRTETTRAIFGIDPKESGQFFLDGKEIMIRRPEDAIRAGIVLAPEDRKKDGLCTKLSIRHNIALPNLDLLCSRMGVVSRTKEDEMCNKVVADLKVKTPNVDVNAGNLSGGNQQKVVVGKWLARNSRVVIFDEPTRGIDVAAKVEIYNLMNQLKQQGIAVMFVSSEMPEVMGIADRIIVMCDGRITGELMADEATQNSILTLATRFEKKVV